MAESAPIRLRFLLPLPDRPDFAPGPAAFADADEAFDTDAPFEKRIAATADMLAAEEAVAERAFIRRMGAAVFHTTEARGIALDDAGLVLVVHEQVLVLGGAGLAGADRLVTPAKMSVDGAESGAAILAGVDRALLAAREAGAPQLANGFSHLRIVAQAGRDGL